MIDDEYRALFDRALSSAYGIAMEVPDHRTARRLRRKLYGIRDKARKVGDHSLDGLSILVLLGFEVWIVKREVLPNQPLDDGILLASNRSLEPDELPRRIGVRGPGRSPFLGKPFGSY